MEFLKHTLPNGLQIVAECNGQAWSTAVGFFVRAGARDESEELAGVSHFLEHMMFKGTPSRSADDVNRAFDEVGASYNAFTSEEHTVYYAAVLPEYQLRAIDLLGDILRPSLRGEDFDVEKQVILEEIRMYEDQPPFGADEKCRALHFGGHPLAHSVLGTAERISALSVDAMRAYFRQRYSARNVVLAASGRVDFDGLVAAADRICGSWEPGSGDRQLAPAAPASQFHVVRRDSATQEYLVQLAPGPSANDDDRYAAKLLATIVGDETGSRIFWELIDTGVAEQASLGHFEYDDAGIFMTYLSCEPGQTASNLQRLDDLFAKVQQEGISAAELAQASNKVCSRIVLASERPKGRLFVVGGDWVQRGEYRSVRDDLDAVGQVTLEQIEAVIRKYPLRLSTTIAIGPLEKVDRPH
ncbi:MAG: pitrilysin family protein [Pirellulales bacterium]|nr:pitrilysin family protein [Thermoguttaceae bacterium]MDD4786110.1 pitrilysin family protein [Pirellulales bacterium]MDI9443395.1 pitrilysin family protein [Planctomycetota bacterium]NLY99525.1 insulinase family protein [Pirellulaceae bacterium]